MHALRGLISIAVVGSVGCSAPKLTEDGGIDDAMRRDAGIVESHDECGNGMDDDDDGDIDEQCPCAAGESQGCFTGRYPNRMIGVCSDGLQECDASTGEFGFWGTCEGSTLPREEACDGALDDDCDGAVDESCPCTEGATSACGAEFLLPPCRSGLQTCTGGVWSACEGAVGPSAEVCEDAIDNDCDGETNEGCGCVPTVERCDDGLDNDCDGLVDEPECERPEGCDGTEVPDFRDRLMWHTSIPEARATMLNTGGHEAMRLDGGTIAISLEPGADPFSFDGSSYDVDQIGYLAFSDGSATTIQAAAGPSDTFDVRAGRWIVGGTFEGDLDIGLGVWTSDPTHYTGGLSGSRPIRDLYFATGAVGVAPATRGRHFTVTGVPSHPDPASFIPQLRPDRVGLDSSGNAYVAGTHTGILTIDGDAVSTELPFERGRNGGFVSSFDLSGGLRWHEPVSIRAGNGARELVVDELGRYVALIVDLHSATELQLRNAETGEIVFAHETSPDPGLLVRAIAIDSAGNLYVMGTASRTDGTLGPLGVAAHQNYIAAFDASGTVRWVHSFLLEVWPAHQSNRFSLATNGTDVAFLFGNHVVSSSRPEADPRTIKLGECARTLPWRVLLREPETGIPVRGASVVPGTPSWEVQDLFLGVLDGATGEHRWSRVIDSASSRASLAFHPGGDVVVALHNDFDAAHTPHDFGSGPVKDATHVFRIRGD